MNNVTIEFKLLVQYLNSKIENRFFEIVTN